MGRKAKDERRGKERPEWKAVYRGIKKDEEGGEKRSASCLSHALTLRVTELRVSPYIMLTWSEWMGADAGEWRRGGSERVGLEG